MSESTKETRAKWAERLQGYPPVAAEGLRGIVADAEKLAAIEGDYECPASCCEETPCDGCKASTGQGKLASVIQSHLEMLRSDRRLACGVEDYVAAARCDAKVEVLTDVLAEAGLATEEGK